MIPFGLCHCGCGKPTLIAKKNQAKRKLRKGFPQRCVQGHGNAGHTHARIGYDNGLGAFKIDGVYCRLIELSGGQWAIVNANRYAELAIYRWRAKPCGGDKSGYYADRKLANGSRVLMHREILGLKTGDSRKGDHKYTLATLDNRDDNLRRASDSQSAMNQRRKSDNTTGFKGVHAIQCKTLTSYSARITVNGKRVSLGRKRTPEAAYQLRLEVGFRYHGEFWNPG